MTARQPSLYIPHGGGPCFFMDDPQGVWTGMGDFLRALPQTLPEAPRAILVVSGHWETQGFAFSGSERPPMIFDYFGFPEHTYRLRYDAPGDPGLAAQAAGLLAAAGLTARVDPERGYDHGVFVPLKVAFPDADVPVVVMSLDASLDPALHLAAGRALAPLRDEGVLIVGSGMSFHNMAGFRGGAAFAEDARAFDGWLTAASTGAPDARSAALAAWEGAPGARQAHPREEHLVPLMVAAAAGGEGKRIYAGGVGPLPISGYAFA